MNSSKNTPQQPISTLPPQQQPVSTLPPQQRQSTAPIPQQAPLKSRQRVSSLPLPPTPEQSKQIQKKLEELQNLAQQDLERAQTAMHDLATHSIQDAKIHWQLGQLCEEIGLFNRALTEYNLVLRDQPNDLNALQRLSTLYYERGSIEQAEHLYRRLLEITPEDTHTALALCHLLDSTGRQHEALSLLLKQQEAATDQAKPPHPALEQAIRRYQRALPQHRSAQRDLAPTTKADADAPEHRTARDPLPEPTDADAIAFAHLFAGREGVYARQWYSGGGKAGYTPVHQAFTLHVAKQHLLGAYTVGIYPVRMDHSVSFLALDVDIAQSALQKAATQPSTQALRQLMRSAHNTARRLLDAATSFQLPAYLEDSGWKGRHLWIFFEEPIPATAARRIGRAILNTAGETERDIHIEIFPKQSRLQADQLGNLIKLPLGIHRVTQRRCLWLEADGSLSPSPLQKLHTLQRISRDHIRDLLPRIQSFSSQSTQPATRQAPYPAQKQPQQPPAALHPTPNDPFSLDESPHLSPHHPSPQAAPPDAAPRYLEPIPPTPYDPKEDQALQTILQGCIVLDEILKRAESSGILQRDEQHVLTYTLGNLPDGAQAVNHILDRILNADPRSRLKSPLRGQPMSCPKIRARVPEIATTPRCNCTFPPSAGAYPSPLSHLHPIHKPQSPNPLQRPSSPQQIEAWLIQLLRAHQEIARLQDLIETLEERTRDAMQHLKIKQLLCPLGEIRLDEHGRLHLLKTPPKKEEKE